MFKTRLLSGIVLVIAAIFLIVTGNEVLLFSTLLISCIGMFELFRVFKFEKSLLSVVPYIALILFYINLRWSFIPDVMMLFMGFLIVLMFVYVLSYPKYDAKQLMAAFFGMFYVGTMLSYVYQIRTLNNGLYLAFLVFLCSCDILRTARRFVKVLPDSTACRLDCVDCTGSSALSADLPASIPDR